MSLVIYGFRAVAQYGLASDSNQYVIVSGRPASEDILYSINSTDKNGLKYIRSNAPLAKEIALASHTELSQNGIAVALFRNFQFVKLLPGDSGLAAVNDRITGVARSQWSAWAITAVLIGLAVGLLLPIRPEWAVPALAALACTAFVKALVACPTCAQPFFLGVSAAVIGAVYFVLVTAAVYAFDSQTVLEASALLVGIVPFWQVYESLLVPLCFPCMLIAFTSAWYVASGISWPGQLKEGRVAASRKKVSLAYAGFAVLPLASFAALQVNPGSPPALGALHPIHNIKVDNIKQLGLAPAGKREVLFVGRLGCGPCEEGLKVVDSLSIKDFAFAYVGQVPPDANRVWVKIPDASLISATPSLLYVSPSGKVVNEIYGLSDNLTKAAEILSDADRFLSNKRSSALGQKNEKQNAI